jgi:hypothetical protein
MIIVKLERNMPLEKALKIYTSKIIRTKQMTQINKKKYHVKDSDLKRDIIKKAVYSRKKKDDLN